MRRLASLVVAAQHGDHSAFGEIVDRFKRMAYLASYARLGDHDLAQDAAQEAFVEAYLSLSKLRDPAAFPGWFRQIVLRQCVRLIRGHAVPVVPLDTIEDIPLPEPTLEEILLQRETQNQLWEAVYSLPLHERIATILFYLDGYSIREISHRLGVPSSTVKKRLFTARVRLRTRMRVLDPGPTAG